MAAALTALTALARAATRWFESPPDSLEAPALAYQRSVGRALNALPRGALVERALRGRAWLGHPLHPLLTDVVAGAWTVAWFLDLLDMAGAHRLRPGADATIALGLAAAPVTALSGATDYRHATGRARRLGLVHAALNGLATLCYARSLVLRWRRRRTAAWAWAHAGAVIVSAGAYLGGELVFGEGMAVEGDRVHADG